MTAETKTFGLLHSLFNSLYRYVKSFNFRSLFDESAPKRYTRDQYKAVWNSVSGTEERAKFAVSGYTDEATYSETAQGSLDMLQRYVGVGKDDVILEIGAGVGRVGAVLAPLCREWIGADVSENMASHIRSRLAHLSNIRAVVLSGYDLAPIPSNSIDVVYSTVVFMHLDEWDRYSYIKEAFRVLRPGGRCLVDNINLASDDGWALFQAHCTVPPADRPAQISKTSTAQELETYFARAGFQDIKSAFAGLWVITYARKSEEVPSGV